MLNEHHLHNCNAAGVMTRRHDALKNVVAEMIKKAKLTPQLEQLAGPGTGAILRFDICADRYNDANQDLKIDITVVNPCTRARAPTSAKQQGSTAIAQRQDKIDKYWDFCSPNDDMYAMVFETFGYMDAPIFHLIHTLAERVGNLPPDTATWIAPNFKTYWIQRLSCCLWRENARTVSTVVRNTAAVYHANTSNRNRNAYDTPVFPVFQQQPKMPQRQSKVTQQQQESFDITSDDEFPELGTSVTSNVSHPPLSTHASFPLHATTSVALPSTSQVPAFATPPRPRPAAYATVLQQQHQQQVTIPAASPMTRTASTTLTVAGATRTSTTLHVSASPQRFYQASTSSPAMPRPIRAVVNVMTIDDESGEEFEGSPEPVNLTAQPGSNTLPNLRRAPRP